MFFKWSDKFRLNVPQIDTDHRNLFAIANRLHEHISDGEHDQTITHALTHLVKYVHEHFDREERLMERFNFPGIVEHRKSHRLLEQIVGSMQKVHGHEPEAIDTGKLMEFLRDWLEQHILVTDQLYEPWVSGGLASEGDGLYVVDDLAANGTPKDETVSVIVPNNKIWVVEECARLLREHDWRAVSIERATTESLTPNLEEAKVLVKDVLR